MNIPIRATPSGESVQGLNLIAEDRLPGESAVRAARPAEKSCGNVLSKRPFGKLQNRMEKNSDTAIH